MSEINSTSGEPLPANEPTAASTDEVGTLADLQKRVEELEAQVKEKEQKYVYLYADFENFKKRSFKEKQDAMKFGWENVAADLLQVSDNLERALAHTPPGTDKNLVAGLQMVLSQFKSTLQKQGVQQIETVQKDFDPHFHEAVAEEASTLPPGKVIREELPGYMLNGRLLRPARVVVSASGSQAG